jgi:primary-amine oxidase
LSIKISRFLAPLLALSSSLLAQSTVPQHPLDGLTTQEYWAVHDILHQSGHMTENTAVSMLVLHPPLKSTVLSWKPGDPIPREADVILEDRNKTIEARVDIVGHKLESWQVVPGVQAPVTTKELNGFDDLIKQDPRVLEAFKKRGLTDLSTIRCSAGPLALRVFPEQETVRVGYGGCTDANGQYHTWGRSIEGLYVLVDLTNKKILQVIDRGIIPDSTYVGDFEGSPATPREGTTPLVVSQPMGPSYKIDKGEITWQNWHFRFRLDSRVGPVVTLVRYQDGAKLRSVMYEGSFSEMYVPYMDVDEGWNSRSFLDAGEFLHDGLLKAIDTDDCPANAEYFAGLAPDERGRPILRTKVACLFERTKGDPAWRHLENNILAGRPSRELVLRTVAEIGNYDYVMDWVFQQDGTIRVALGSTGIIETKGTKDTVVLEHAIMSGASEYGTLVAPNSFAVNHDHYFSFRLDLDVDGPNNSFMVERLVPQKISARTRTSIWTVQSSVAKTESQGIQDIDMHSPAMWHFVSSTERGPLGYPTGYEIMPGATGVSFLSPDDPAERVGAFSSHQLWVTPYNPDERYAAGVYVTSSKGREGLAKWTQANRPIENTDIVAWYTLGFHHVPRIEDWPVMPTLWHEFLIRPVHFAENPVMTLPHQP